MSGHRWFVFKSDTEDEFKIREYDPREDLDRAFKFLYFEAGDILLVGDVETENHFDLLKIVREKMRLPLTQKPDAAGDLLGPEITY